MPLENDATPFQVDGVAVYSAALDKADRTAAFVEAYESIESDTAPLTADEVRAFLKLCDGPTSFLYAHGWKYHHTPLTLSCAAKLRRIAGLPRDGDLP
jgi:hypothetical protein